MTVEQREVLRLEQMDALGFGVNAMKQIRICTNCGVVSPASGKQCVSCGAELPAQTLYEQYRSRHKCCGSCEIIVPAGSRYCPQCGNKLTE